MGVGQRQAGSSVKTGVWGCGRAEAEDRGYAITSQRTAKAKRITRCKYCFNSGPQSQRRSLISNIEFICHAIADIHCAK